MHKTLQELVPVRKVEYVVLSMTKTLELLDPAFGAHYAGFEILAAKDVVHVLQSPAAKCEPNGSSQKLIRTRIEEGILSGRACHLRIDS
jgi:hypothetical protein